MSSHLSSAVPSIGKPPAAGSRRWVGIGVALFVGLILVVLLLVGMTAFILAAPPAAPLATVNFNLGGTSIPDANDHYNNRLWPGRRVTYTFTIDNYSDEPVTAYFTDTLPSGLEFVSLDEPSCGHSDGVITCMENLAAFEDWDVQIIAQLPLIQNVLHDRLLSEAEAMLEGAGGSLTRGRDLTHYVQNAGIAKPNSTSVDVANNGVNQAVAGELVTITVFFTIPQGTIVYNVTPRVLLHDGLWPYDTDPVTVSRIITTTSVRYPQSDLDRVAAVNGYQMEFERRDAITDTDSGPQVLSYTIYAYARQYHFLDPNETSGELRVQPILRWCAYAGCPVDHDYYNDDRVYVAHNPNQNPGEYPRDNPNVAFVRPYVRPSYEVIQQPNSRRYAYLDDALIGQGGGGVAFKIRSRSENGRPTAYDVVLTAILGPGLDYSDSYGYDVGEGNHWTDNGLTYITWTVPVSLPAGQWWDAWITATLPTTFVIGTEFTATAAVRQETFAGDVPDEGVYVVPARANESPTLMPGVGHEKQAWPSNSEYLRIGDTGHYTVVTTLGAGTYIHGPYYTDTLPLGFHLSGTVHVDGEIPVTVTDVFTAPGEEVNDSGGRRTKEEVAWYMDDLDNTGSSTPRVITATYQAEFSGLDTDGLPVYASFPSDLRDRTERNKAALYWLLSPGVFRSSLDDDAIEGIRFAQPKMTQDFDTERLESEADVAIGDIVKFKTEFRNTGRVDAYDVHVCDTLPQGLGVRPDATLDAPPECTGASIVSYPLEGTQGDVCWVINRVCQGVDAFGLTYETEVLPNAIPGIARTNNAYIGDYSSQPGGTDDGNDNDDDLPAGVRFDRHYGDFPTALPAAEQCAAPRCPFTVLGLGARKTSWVTRVVPGDLITYTLAYTNTEATSHDGVVITDAYDVNLNFVTADPHPPITDATQRLLVWDVGTLGAGEAGEITLTMQVTPVIGNNIFAVTNTMEWDSDQTIPKVWVESTRLDVPNLHVQMTGPTTTRAGDSISYTVTYSNDGSASLPVTLTFDYGYLTYDHATIQGNPTDPVPGTTNVFVDTALPSDGTSHTLIVWLTVKAPLPYNLEQIDSSVTIESIGATPDTADFTIALLRPVITLRKAGPPTPPDPGGGMRYDIYLMNNGTYTATGLILTDIWDANTDYDIQNDALGWTNHGTYATYTETELGIGEAMIVFFNVTVDVLAPSYTNTVLLATDQTEGHKADSEVWKPSIATYKTVEPDPAFPGRMLTYTIYYTSSAVVITPVITDHLPSSALFSYAGCSSQPSDWLCDLVGGDVVWERDNLVNGATGQLQVWGEVAAAEGQWLYNWTESTGIGAFRRPGEVELTTRVARPWLSVVKRVGDDHPLAPGNRITYTLVYSNYNYEDNKPATDPAHNVFITDALPGEVTFVSCDPAPCTPSDDVVTWNLGDVPTGTQESVTLIVQVKDGTSGQTARNADYNIWSDRLPPDETLSGPPVEILILDPNLTLVKTADPGIVSAVNDPITYTIFYINDGGGLLRSVVITDELTSSTPFGRVSPGCTHSGEPLGGTVVCVIGDQKQGQSGVVGIHVTAGDLSRGEEIANTAEAQGISDAKGDTVSVNSNTTSVWFGCIPPARPNFEYRPAAPQTGEMTTFTGSVAVEVEADYTWDFGDGKYGSGQVVVHTYAVSGTYTVVMTATNDCDTSSLSKDVFVTGELGDVYLPLVLRNS
jgi:uncharacterized repeat protein (TIGR01451 family)